jgi:hypothetical protein
VPKVPSDCFRGYFGYSRPIIYERQTPDVQRRIEQSIKDEAAKALAAEHGKIPLSSLHCEWHQVIKIVEVRFWHLAGNPTEPAFVRFWTKADKDRFWPGTLCPLMTHQRHWLCTAAMVLMTGAKNLMTSLEKAYSLDISIREADEKLPAQGVAVNVDEFDKDGVVYEKDGVKVIAFEVDHGAAIKPAYGYRIEYKGVRR